VKENEKKQRGSGSEWNERNEEDRNGIKEAKVEQ
jgi:hypothetical protein